MEIPKKLNITIEQHKGYLTAYDDKHGMITSADNINELFDMIADSYKCVFEIKVPFRQWLLYKIFRI